MATQIRNDRMGDSPRINQDGRALRTGAEQDFSSYQGTPDFAGNPTLI
jgi:hypothetical protein